MKGTVTRVSRTKVDYAAIGGALSGVGLSLRELHVDGDTYRIIAKAERIEDTLGSEDDTRPIKVPSSLKERKTSVTLEIGGRDGGERR